MTRRDYIKFADMFLRAKPDEYYAKAAMYACTIAWSNMVRKTADIFADDNPNFNRAKFYEACGYETH